MHARCLRASSDMLMMISGVARMLPTCHLAPPLQTFYVCAVAEVTLIGLPGAQCTRRKQRMASESIKEVVDEQHRLAYRWCAA